MSFDALESMRKTTPTHQPTTNGIQQKPQQPVTKPTGKVDSQPSNDEYISQKEKDIKKYRGAFAGIFDKLKSVVGYGNNKKKALQKLEEYKEGKVSKEDLEKTISDYEYGKRDTNELMVDALTGLAAFAMAKNAKNLGTIASLFTKKATPEITKKAAFGISVLTGMTLKPILSKLNNLGAKKDERKKQGGFFRNAFTGAIDGAIAPIALMTSAVVALPSIFGINAVTRYVTQKREGKSFKDFAEQQVNNVDVKALAAAGATYKVIKGKTSVAEWEKAVKNVSENSKNFKKADFSGSSLSEFDELAEQIGLDFGSLLKADGRIASIIHNPNLSTTEKMREIEKYNLFIPKYLQMVSEMTLMKHGITGDKMKELMHSFIPKPYSPEEINTMIAAGKTNTEIANAVAQRNAQIEAMKEELNQIKSPNDELGAIVARFRSDCPATRNGKQAQEVIQRTYGDKYEIISENPLGVGTVAETFLAKDKTTGKEVVIKMLKEGMSAEKIETDRQAIIKMIEEQHFDDPKMKEYFINRTNSLFEAWTKEVDLAHEMEAAGILAKNARNFKVVKPVEIKDNIYVMEKADGVQMDKLVKFFNESEEKHMSADDARKIITDYMKIFLEQQLSIPTKGKKVLHADPHGGNIFVDPSNPNKAYTMIDAGNVLEFTPHEQIQNLFGFVDNYIGYTESLVKAALKDAKLPEGMSMADAEKLLNDTLKNQLYTGNNKINGVKLNKLVNDLLAKSMRDNHIIGASHNTNLLKANETYLNNFDSLTVFSEYLDGLSPEEQKKLGIIMLKEIGKELAMDVGNGFIHNPVYIIREINNRLNHISGNKERFLGTLKGMQENGVSF